MFLLNILSNYKCPFIHRFFYPKSLTNKNDSGIPLITITSDIPLALGIATVITNWSGGQMPGPNLRPHHPEDPPGPHRHRTGDHRAACFQGPGEEPACPAADTLYRKVGIITACEPALTKEHLAAIGLDDRGLITIGMEHFPEFSSVFLGNKQTLDQGRCAAEMQAATEQLIQRHPDVGAIVLECTNMPPYSRVVQKATGGLPVFDVVTMINYAWQVIRPENVREVPLSGIPG
jgi:hypothetical protein